MLDWSIDWLINWLIDWLIDWLVGSIIMIGYQLGYEASYLLILLCNRIVKREEGAQSSLYDLSALSTFWFISTCTCIFNNHMWELNDKDNKKVDLREKFWNVMTLLLNESMCGSCQGHTIIKSTLCCRWSWGHCVNNAVLQLCSTSCVHTCSIQRVRINK